MRYAGCSDVSLFSRERLALRLLPLSAAHLLKRQKAGTSLVVQWLGTHTAMQGTWVRSLVQEDLTCCGPTEPVL